MLIRDYYSILEVEPGTGTADIRKAYRRLAQFYHPDKTNNDPEAGNRFAAIKEAYEVLTDPTKKEYYLQQRWYDQSIGKRKKETVLTPASFLKEAIELERYVSRLDHFRMDRTGLQEYMEGLFSTERVDTINTYNDTTANAAIIQAVMPCCRVLSLNAVLPIAGRMRTLLLPQESIAAIDAMVKQLEQNNRKDRFRIWILLLITLLLCLLIFLVSR